MLEANLQGHAQGMAKEILEILEGPEEQKQPEQPAKETTYIGLGSSEYGGMWARWHQAMKELDGLKKAEAASIQVLPAERVAAVIQRQQEITNLLFATYHAMYYGSEITVNKVTEGDTTLGITVEVPRYQLGRSQPGKYMDSYSSGLLPIGHTEILADAMFRVDRGGEGDIGKSKIQDRARFNEGLAKDNVIVISNVHYHSSGSRTYIPS